MLSRILIAFLSIVLVFGVVAAVFQGSELTASSSGDESSANTANYQQAEKFSDAGIYNALYGPEPGDSGRDESSESNKNYIKFHTKVIHPHWIEGSSDFWYTFKSNGAYSYYLVKPAQASKELLFDPVAVSRLLEQKAGESVDLSEQVPKSMLVKQGGNLIEIEVGGKALQYSRVSEAVTERDAEPTNDAVSAPSPAEFSESPDGQYMVFAEENNLFVRSRDGETYQLTDDGEPWYGYSRQVGSRDSQPPLRNRLSWIGSTNKFYVVRWDSREVGEMWFIDSLAEPRPTLHTTRFAMPGEKHTPIPELWIFDAETRSGLRVDADKWPGQFLGDMDLSNRGFQPSEDGKELYFVRMSRGFHDVELLKTDVETGEVETLISESADPYFTIRFPQFAVLNGGSELLWLSDRSGHNHYYLYDGSGSLENPVTSGDFMASRIEYLDEENRYMIAGVFGKDPEAYPFHRQYYKFPLDGGEPIQLTPEDSQHEASFSPDGKFFVDNYSRADAAPTIVLRNTDGELVMPLEQLDTKRLREMGFQMQEYFNVKAADGETDLYGVMWKPADFDSTRSYPVIAAVQQNASISGADFGRFRPGNVAVQLAQLGFVILEFRTRGQGRHVRERDYTLHSYNNERDFPMADAKTVVEQMTARHEFLDQDRVGVYGHSGGGFMAAALCMTYPSIFKVCVASSGNHDNRIAEQNSSEFHWGVNATGEGENLEWMVNLHPNQELAEGLDSKMLIIHGDNDTDTYFSQSVRLADALIKANKQFDFMIMPSKNHSYGEYDDYFNRLRWAYFSEHLLGDKRSFVDLKNPKELTQ